MSAEATPLDVIEGRADWCAVTGDATAVLASLPAGFAAVTYCDPPYGLSAQSTDDVFACLRAWLSGEVYAHRASGFMAKAWDAFVPGPEAWRAVHRCLKPGGYCVAFSSTRTVDLLGMAVRLAGFEIREGMAYVFGQGFPKSLDVSKACDDAAGAERKVVGLRVFGDGQTYNGGASAGRSDGGLMGNPTERGPSVVTAPSSPAAVEWSGYGTTVKPSMEPLVVARKPLDILSYCDTIGSCLRQLLATCVAPTSTSSHLESTAECGSAPMRADPSPSPGDSSEAMDTSSSRRGEGLGLNLSTVLSWHATLAELCSLVSTFTTEMESSLTIDLKILSCSLLKFTERSTLQSQTSGHGESTNVASAAWMFDVVRMKLGFIRASSADESATERAPLTCQERAGKVNSGASYEPLVVARKALDGTVAHNVVTHGCGALNIDAARIGTGSDRSSGGPQGTMPQPMSAGEPSRPDRQRPTGGRFPASLALVHDEECVCEGTQEIKRSLIETIDRTTSDNPAVSTYGDGLTGSKGGGQTTETIDAWHCTPTCAVAELGRQSGNSKSSIGVPRSGSNGDGWGMTATGSEYADQGTAARFFYQAKASASDRLAYVTCSPGCAHHDSVAGVKAARASARDASREHPHGFCRACGSGRHHYGHPTVKPLDLARYHARLLSLPAHTRPIALVPYCGTGIEARALLEVGFRVIAIDLDPRHTAMTAHRLGGTGTPAARQAPQPAAARAPTDPAPKTPDRQLSLFGEVA